MFSGEDVGDIGHSLRFRSSASAYLSRTFGSPTSSSVFTLSLWVKRGGLTGTFRLFGASTSTYLTFNSSDQLNLTLNGASACTSTAVFRDPTAHYHIVYQQNGSAQTLYVNNTSVATGTTAAAIFNTAIAHQLGAANTSNYLDGYLSRVCFVDGTALTPSSFGYLNTNLNEWVSNSQSAIKAAVDAGGTNSFMLDFNDNTSLTTLGNDFSTHNNDWTLNNISLTAGSTYDWMLDVPGNSYATLNPLDNTSGTFFSANLQYAQSSTGDVNRCSVAPTTGKWYWEAEYTASGSVNGSALIGVMRADITRISSTSVGTLTGGAWAYRDDGLTITGGVSVGGFTNFSSGAKIMVALDLDAQKLWWGYNGVWEKSGAVGDPAAGTNPAYSLASAGLPIAPFFGFQAATGSESWDANFGQRPFAYTPPTGFLALNQANLSASGTVIVSGSFTGNASTDGPFIWMNGVPDTLTINGNAVTFGTHADKLANGFKLRTSSASYNVAGSNTWTATITSDTKNIFKYNTSEGNP